MKRPGATIFAQPLLASPLGPPSTATLLVAAVSVGLGAMTAIVLSSTALSPRRATLLILAGLFPFVGLIIGRLRELLLAILILDIPFGFDVHFAYRGDIARFGGLAGFNVSATTGCLLLLYLLWLGEFICKKGPRPVPSLRASLPFVLYVAFVGLSAFVAADAILSAFQFALLLQMLLLYIYIVSTIRTRWQVIFIVTMLLIGLTAESLVMIITGLTGRDLSLMAISTGVDPSYMSGGRAVRLGGTFGSPNNAAGYLGMLMLLASSVFFTPLGRFYRYLAVFAFCAGGVALILTSSRGGWASFAVSLLILWLLAWRRGLLSFQSAFVIVISTVLLSAFFHGAILSRLLGDDQGAAYSRIPLMELAFRIIRENPLLGVGANNFAAVMDQYVTPYFRSEWLYTVHNRYLLIWAETGILGLLAFLWFLATTLRVSWSCSRSRDRFLVALSFGFTAAILCHTAHMLVDVFNDRSLPQLLWLSAGIIAAMTNIDRNG